MELFRRFEAHVQLRGVRFYGATEVNFSSSLKSRSRRCGSTDEYVEASSVA